MAGDFAVQLTGKRHPFGLQHRGRADDGHEYLRDLFDQTARAAQILGAMRFRQKVLIMREEARSFSNRQAGNLQEWMHDWDVEAPEQQHAISRICMAVSQRADHTRGTPALAAAAAKT
jgi:alpha-L-fucosidase 2